MASWVVRAVEPLGGSGVAVRLDPPGSSRRPGDERLVLTRDGTRYDVVLPAGPPGPVEVTLDLGRDGGPPTWMGTWDLAIEAPGGALPVAPDPKALTGFAVVAGTGPDAPTVRVVPVLPGGLQISVEPPWAEAVRLVEPAQGTWEIGLRLPHPPRAGWVPAALLLVRRGDGLVQRLALADPGTAVVDLDGPARAHAGGQDIWDVRAEGGDGHSVPVARHLDAVAGKAGALQYAWQQVAGRKVRPYWTLGDGLALAVRQVEPVPAVSPRRAPGRGTPAAPAAASAAPAVRLLLRHLLALLWKVLDRLSPPPVDAGRPTLRFLIVNAYGMGGTVRTTLTTAHSLSDRYDVEVVSLRRDRDVPALPFPEGLRVRALTDGRKPGRLAAWLDTLPSLLVDPQEPGYRWMSLWGDLALLRELRRRRGGVLVTTRAAFNLLAVHHARPGLVLVGQEHRHAGSYRPRVVAAIARDYRSLDALTVLTAGDEADYRRILSGARTRVQRLPNAVPEVPGVPAAVRRPVLVAAGRLKPAKGFDLLIDAFAQVADLRPQWSVHVHGVGADRRALQALAQRRGLAERVLFPGRTQHLGHELSRAGVFVLSSRLEGFPMVLLEAMGKGAPVVAFDCPTGPGELVVDGVNGLLVPDRDVDALAAALLRATGDADLRAAMGAAALVTARDYDAAALALRWDRLLRDLTEVRR